MVFSNHVNELTMLHLKHGVNLENIDVGDTRLSAKLFIELAGILKEQKGFRRHFHGHEVEDRTVFVWCVEWDSWEDVKAFLNSTDQKALEQGMAQIFDLEKAAPLTMYSNYSSNTTSALEAPVTEVAYFTLPTNSLEVAKSMIDEAEITAAHPVITIGKSTGGATGFVFKTCNTSNITPEGHSIAFVGVFGYAEVKDHLTWRETPEHAQVIKEMSASPLVKLGMGEPILPGGNIFVKDSSMVHVEFQTGI